LLRSTGPKLDIVARSGTPTPCAPRAKNSVGHPSGVHAWPIFCVRAVNFSLTTPGDAKPDRSPLMSAAKTGTPAAEICSAINCKVFVLPVPVAPATNP